MYEQPPVDVLRRPPLWRVKEGLELLRHARLSPHEAGCACWDCVIDLMVEVAVHRAEIMARAR